jgi:hypothetical protein
MPSPTKPKNAFPLLSDEDAELVAEECRSALLAFMNGALEARNAPGRERGWTKRELAEWLTGPYTDATRHHPRGARYAASGAVDRIDASVDELVENVRLSALAALADAVAGREDFVADAIRGGAIAEAKTQAGGKLWVPVDGRHRLELRVYSLIAVDYCTRPRDYRRLLFICPECESVAFDEDLKKRGRCGTHPRTQGLVTPGPDVVIRPSRLVG